MIDLQQMYEWRWKDESNGLVLPYYTRPALDWLQQLDLTGKYIYEFGMGASSVYYNNKTIGRTLSIGRSYGVDSNKDWLNAVCDEINNDNERYYFADNQKDYVESIYKTNRKFDIIVIDGIYRDECVEPALKQLKPNGYLIVDNWMQESCWMAAKNTQDILLSMAHNIYKQEGHPDWKTLVVENYNYTIDGMHVDGSIWD